MISWMRDIMDPKQNNGGQPDTETPAGLRSRSVTPRRIYAMAAGVLLMAAIGTYFLVNRPLTTTVRLEPPLQALFTQDQAMVWQSGPRVRQFATLLKERGIAVGPLKQVVLAKPYTAAKDFSATPEELFVRIVGGVAYVSVRPPEAR